MGATTRAGPAARMRARSILVLVGLCMYAGSALGAAALLYTAEQQLAPPSQARAQQARALVSLNGGFETGDFTNWDTKDISSPFLSLGVGISSSIGPVEAVLTMFSG